ncbi:hypothetical protein FOZ60_014046 [Perkinsus olseni]|uniref:Uncharacterized protein n=1 Tax=Perkinsus olseni TaxID=32597 RepID=A0A7J6N8G6_PEROL|nr:hypothetical protein FOZ60_014046 [Perkinsus olseni]
MVLSFVSPRSLADHHPSGFRTIFVAKLNHRSPSKAPTGSLDSDAHWNATELRLLRSSATELQGSPNRFGSAIAHPPYALLVRSVPGSSRDWSLTIDLIGGFSRLESSSCCVLEVRKSPEVQEGGYATSRGRRAC